MISSPHIINHQNLQGMSSSFGDNKILNQKEDLEEVGRQFGELMVKEILKNALKSSSKSGGLFSNKSAGGDLQFGLIVDTLSQAISSTQSFGFGDMLETSLSNNENKNLKE